MRTKTMAKKKAEEPAREEKRTQMPIRVKESLLNRIRNMLYWAPRGRNFQSFGEQALGDAITEIEKRENDGEPWEQRPEGK